MKKFWIVNKINPNTAEILLYGYISEYDCSASDFVIELSQLASVYNDITIRINSGGGSVFEGIAIYNAIKQLQKNGKKIATSVDGIAASMGGVIAIAGSPCRISKYGRMMTHEASSGAFGTADEIKQELQLLEDIQVDIVKIFATRTGLSDDQVTKKFFQKGVDNWMNAALCVQNGLADEVYDADPVPVPEDVKDVKQIQNIFSTVLNKSISQSQNNNMNKIIAKLLGLPEDATESQIEAALTASLGAKKIAEDAITNIAKTRAESLVTDAITAKKITADKKEMFVTNAISNFDATKAMLDLIPAAKKPTELINQIDSKLLNIDDEGNKIPVAVTGKPGEAWDNLVSQGLPALEKVKKETPDVYAKMYKDKYNREPSAMGFTK